MSNFVFDDEILVAGKVDLDTFPAVAAINKILGTEWNVLSADLTDLSNAIKAGQFHGLENNQSASLSTAGGVNLRSNSGTLEVSENGAAYAVIRRLPSSGPPSGQVLVWNGTDWVSGILFSDSDDSFSLGVWTYDDGTETQTAPFGTRVTDGVTEWPISGMLNCGVVRIESYAVSPVTVTADPPILASQPSYGAGGAVLVVNRGPQTVTFSTGTSLVLKTATISLATNDSFSIVWDMSTSCFIEVGRSVA
jgi:hypothetical protein